MHYSLIFVAIIDLYCVYFFPLTIAKKALFNRPWKYFLPFEQFPKQIFFLARNDLHNNFCDDWKSINYFSGRRARTVACYLQTISTWNVISPFTTVKLASYYFCLQFCDWIWLWFVDKVWSSTHKNCPNTFVS